MGVGGRDGGAEAAARYRQYEYKAVRAARCVSFAVTRCRLDATRRDAIDRSFGLVRARRRRDRFWCERTWMRSFVRVDDDDGWMDGSDECVVFLWFVTRVRRTAGGV